MWTAPPGRIRLGGRVDSRPKAGAHQMNQIARIGLDIAKRWFQVHAVDSDGREVLNRKLPRDKVLGFLAALSPCDVALEACSSSHYWGREIGRLGHRVRLISPNYVKPYLKRGKSDAHDARAICEAASRPDMRFVRVKSEEQQAALMQHTSRQLLIDQRTAVANSLRGQLAEFGVIERKGIENVGELVRMLDEDNEELAQIPAGGAHGHEDFGGSVESRGRARVGDRRADRGLATGERCGPGAQDHSGHWRVDQRGLGRACFRSLHLPHRPRLRCVARSGSATELQRRKGKAWQDNEARQSVPAPSPRPRSDGELAVATNGRIHWPIGPSGSCSAGRRALSPSRSPTS